MTREPVLVLLERLRDRLHTKRLDLEARVLGRAFDSAASIELDRVLMAEVIVAELIEVALEETRERRIA